MEDKIALEWVTYCLGIDIKDPRKWFCEKREFFEQHKEHLENLGFSQNRNSVENALDNVALSHYENLSGSLLLIRVGTDDKPASDDDLKVVKRLFETALKGIDGFSLIIHSRNIQVSQLSIPQLKRLEKQSIAITEENLDKAEKNIVIDEQSILM